MRRPILLSSHVVVDYDFEKFILSILNFYLCSFNGCSLIQLKPDSHLPKKIIYFNDSPLKMMKNAFYFILKALFGLKIYKFFSWLFGHVEKWLHQKDKVNFTIYDVTTWLTNNPNTHIARYPTK